MKKRHALYAVLLIAAVVGLMLLSTPSRSKKKRAKRSSTRSVQPRGGKTRLQGVVRRADGSPVQGATVFVLPKKQLGGIRDRLPHEVSDAQGRWALRARDVETSWIGVVAAGYRHAWLDGARVVAGTPLEHRIERAPALRVRLVDGQDNPIRKKGVQLETWPPRTTFFLPGPNARQGEQWKVTDADGTATFRVGEGGPVTLKPDVEGYHAVSGVRWLAKPEGEVTLRMQPSLSLALKLMAAESLLGLHTIVTVDLHEKETGRLALSHTATPDEDGLLTIRRAIRPGTYDIHVHGEGRGSALLPSIALTANAKTNFVSARLPAAQKRATLRLNLGPGTPSSGRRRRAPLVFLFRPGAPWRTHGWEPGAPESWNRNTRSLVLQLRPGRYHLLIADVLSKRAALLRDVELAAGAIVDAKAPMRPGLRTSVNALVAANGKTRSVAVAGVGAGTLPVYGITGDGRIRVSRSADVLGRVDEGLGVYLGPYPFDFITVRVTGWDGGVVTHDVER